MSLTNSNVTINDIGIIGLYNKKYVKNERKASHTTFLLVDIYLCLVKLL